MKTSQRHLSPKQRERLATRQTRVMTSSYVDDKMGKMAYDAFMVQLGDMDTPWDALPRAHQEAWISAARTVEYFVAGRSESDAA